jgi:hypothetical protein
MIEAEAGDGYHEMSLGQLPLRWVPTEKQLADCLTKFMDATLLRECVHRGWFELFGESKASEIKAVKAKQATV